MLLSWLNPLFSPGFNPILIPTNSFAPLQTFIIYRALVIYKTLPISRTASPIPSSVFIFSDMDKAFRFLVSYVLFISSIAAISASSERSLALMCFVATSILSSCIAKPSWSSTCGTGIEGIPYIIEEALVPKPQWWITNFPCPKSQLCGTLPQDIMVSGSS